MMACCLRQRYLSVVNEGKLSNDAIRVQNLSQESVNKQLIVESRRSRCVTGGIIELNNHYWCIHLLLGLHHIIDL